jgi:hypothetical protein
VPRGFMTMVISRAVLTLTVTVELASAKRNSPRSLVVTPFNRRFTGLDNNDRGRDAGGARVINCADEAAAKVLGFARKYCEKERQNHDEI